MDFPNHARSVFMQVNHSAGMQTHEPLFSRTLELQCSSDVNKSTGPSLICWIDSVGLLCAAANAFRW